jgi:hypothetical protein
MTHDNDTRPTRSRLSTALLALAVVSLSVGCASKPQVRLADAKTPALFAEAPPAQGRVDLQRTGEGDANEFAASCRNFPAVATRQKEPVWCWAACAEMVHRYNGNPMTQDEIATRVTSGKIGQDETAARAASEREIMFALNPEMRDAYADLVASRIMESLDRDAIVTKVYPSQYLKSGLERWSINSDEIVLSILKGEPVLIGLTPDGEGSFGHVYALYGITFSRRLPSWMEKTTDAVTDIDVGEYELKDFNVGATPIWFSIHSVDAIDPWTGRSETIPAERLKREIDFALNRDLARLILQEEMAALKSGRSVKKNSYIELALH